MRFDRTVLLLSALMLVNVSCNKGDKTPESSMSKDLSQVIINEIAGADDFIELLNTGKEEVSLEGAKIRRMRTVDGADDEQTLWTGTSGVSIKPGQFLNLSYAEGKESEALYLKRDFSGSKNACIWLQDSKDTRICEFKRGVKGPGWNTVHMQKSVNDAEGYKYSYSLVSGSWVYAQPTPGAVNSAKVGAIDQTMMYVVINEIDLINGHIELYNMGTSDVDISGMQLRWSRIKDSEEDNKTIWEAPAGTSIKGGAFLDIATLEVDIREYVNRNIHIRFRNPSKTDFTNSPLAWDDFKRGKKGSGWTTETLSAAITGSFARIPDGTGSWYLATQPTPGATNGKTATGKLVPDVDQD